jgi:hypothetical protein
MNSIFCSKTLRGIVPVVLLGWSGLVPAGCNQQAGRFAVVGPHPEGVADAEGAGGAGSGHFTAAGEQAVPSGEGFVFSKDKGGEALFRILPPAGVLPPGRDLPAGPVLLREPPDVLRPSLPLPALSGLPVVTPPQKPLPLRPRHLAEQTPLTDHRVHPAVPVLREFSTGARIAIAADVDKAVPLPYLGIAGYDRVPLEDPTADASLQAALTGPAPPRTAPVPFTPLTLPDPFQHAQTIRLRTIPPESPEPIAAMPKPPPSSSSEPAKK